MNRNGKNKNAQRKSLLQKKLIQEEENKMCKDIIKRLEAIDTHFKSMSECVTYKYSVAIKKSNPVKDQTPQKIPVVTTNRHGNPQSGVEKKERKK